MDYFNKNQKELIEKLTVGNLYSALSDSEKEIIERGLLDYVWNSSNAWEKQFGTGKIGVRLEITEEMRLSVRPYIGDETYRGKIVCSKLVIIAMYEMFFSMNYENIVIDRKNIENVKFLLFYFAMVSVLVHELAHIYRGHLYLYKKWEKEETLEEHIIDIQTLEWDADSMAATILANIIKLTNYDVETRASDFTNKIVCGAIQGAMYWQRYENDFDRLKAGQHPVTIYRAISMQACLGELLGNMENVRKYVALFESEFNRFFNIDKIVVRQYWEKAKEYADIFNEYILLGGSF